jgi:glucose-6-phosphate 1-dehydrogenase
MTIAAPQSQVKTSIRPAEPCEIMIFGAAGDLTKRPLLPAIYNLAQSNLLPQKFPIVGVAHTSMSLGTEQSR